MPTLRDLFEEALKLTPDERTRLLARQRRNPGLRAELERLLAADATGDEWLPTGDAARAAQVIGEAEAAEPLPAGSRIGSYELLEVVGEGGSSTVFRAVREVEGVRQEVALKLLARGLYTAEARRRFHHERAALARLRHPGIARLIDGGVANNGLAYIVLELIEGVAITRYVQDRALSERQRLTLFLKVCRAVESAHRALIVHRDLKPSNVLVTAEGDVKLLDFGIAKLLDDTGDATHTRHQALTPAYAAPEQFTSSAITTATDVYALGVLLRELLSGERRLPDAANTPAPRIARSGVSPSNEKLAHKKLRGDLANIIAKATALEPERRYGFAGALAEDVERYLGQLPVQAHPPSQWYRAGRFIVRHRGGVAVTGILLTAILASMSVALWQARVARRAAQHAEAIQDFVVDLLRKTAPDVAANQRPDVPTLVYTVAKTLPQQFRDQPELRAQLLYTLGNVLRDMGDIPHSEVLLREAAASVANLPATSSVRMQSEIGLIRTLIRKGDYDDANRRIVPLLAIPPTALPDDVARAELLKLGMVIADGYADMDVAVARGREMLKEYRANCSVRGDCGELSSATHDLASVLLDADRIVEAQGLADETLRLRQHGSTPGNLANAYELESKLALYRGDLDAADADARQADALLDSLGNGLQRKSLEPQMQRIEVLLIKEQATQAAAQADSVIAEKRARGDSRCDIAWSELQRSRAALLEKRVLQAIAVSQQTIHDGMTCRRDIVRDVTVTLAQLEYGRALAAAGDARGAQTAYARAAAMNAQTHADDPLSWPLYLIDSMRLAAALDHKDDAAVDARALIATLDRAEALPIHPWRLEARLWLAGSSSTPLDSAEAVRFDAALARIRNWPVGARLADLRAQAR